MTFFILVFRYFFLSFFSLFYHFTFTLLPFSGMSQFLNIFQFFFSFIALLILCMFAVCLLSMSKVGIFLYLTGVFIVLWLSCGFGLSIGSGWWCLAFEKWKGCILYEKWKGVSITIKLTLGKQKPLNSNSISGLTDINLELFKYFLND